MLQTLCFQCFFFRRDRSTELICTIENLQLNNKRLVEQHTAMQAQVCGVICIHTASNRFFFEMHFFKAFLNVWLNVETAGTSTIRAVIKLESSRSK